MTPRASKQQKKSLIISYLWKNLKKQKRPPAIRSGLIPKAISVILLWDLWLLNKKSGKQQKQHFRVSNFEQPNNPEIIRCLGWTIFHAGRQEEGISTILRALSLRKDDPAILCDLAACYLQMNKFDESIELLEKAMDVDSADDRVSELFHVANRLKKAFASEIS
jgi:tetratricopeptide (TPR) repeat protein